MTAPLLSARNLSKTFVSGPSLRLFGTKRFIRSVARIDLDLQRGEVVGLIGESGSGKSTLGRLLLGLLAPSEGGVSFDGVDLGTVEGAAMRNLRKRMQLIFQDPYSSLDPRRTVGAQIEDGLVIHGLGDRAARKRRVAELLDQVGLMPEHAERHPHAFSGGQRQRIGIARALATEPEFLVADEPVSALDVSIQAQVLELLAKLRTQLGLSMLFISHDLSAVRHLCDRIVVLYLGRVMEIGPTETVFRNPRHPYTRALLSAIPMLDSSRAQKREILSGDPPSPANPPSGCVFRTRCPRAIPACAADIPALEDFGDGHGAACILAR